MFAPVHNEDFLLDQKTFEDIYRQHWRMVFGVCYRYLKDEELAKEIVQDIFESLWKRKDHLKIHDSIDKYLAGAAKLAAFDHLRKVNRLPEICSLDHTDLQVATTCTEEQVLANSLTERVAVLADALPEKSKVVFEMSRNQGLNIKEIASAMLVSENTVKYHIGYVLRYFKTGLKEFL